MAVEKRRNPGPVYGRTNLATNPASAGIPTRGGTEPIRVGEQRLLECLLLSRSSGRAPFQPQRLQPPGPAEVVPSVTLSFAGEA